jgi:hypothetical protein
MDKYCRICGVPTAAAVCLSPAVETLIKEAKAWRVRPGVQRRIDALANAIEDLEGLEKSRA